MSSWTKKVLLAIFCIGISTYLMGEIPHWQASVGDVDFRLMLLMWAASGVAYVVLFLVLLFGLVVLCEKLRRFDVTPGPQKRSALMAKIKNWFQKDGL